MDRKLHENIFNQFNSSYPQALSSSAYKNVFSSASMGVSSNLNPRQIFWIKKRKLRRESLDSLMKSNDSNYIYESRHKHAMKRQRASTGRFLTKQELSKLNEN